MERRRCNECTLCCRLVPVWELQKKANQRCGFVRAGKGCSVYRSAAYPTSCTKWACMWLTDPSADLPRPDRAHYVVDQFLDYIELEYHGERARIDVVQVWVDPKHPEAHRDPLLRAWLELRAAMYGQAALIRFNEKDALTLFPPSMTSTGEWVEHVGGRVGSQHSITERMNF